MRLPRQFWQVEFPQPLAVALGGLAEGYFSTR
jgi:hypothetical protein